MVVGGVRSWNVVLVEAYIVLVLVIRPVLRYCELTVVFVLPTL